MSELAILLSVALVVLTWITWRIFRHLILGSPLNNLKGPPAQSFATGNLLQLFDPVTNLSFHQRLTEEYGGIVKVNWLLGEPALFVSDPKALHGLLDKISTFELSDDTLWFNHLVLGEGLVSMTGEKYRRLRKLLSPLFSTYHLRTLTPTFYGVAHKLKDTLASRVAVEPKEIDMHHWMCRTSLEAFGQCGLGHSFDTLTEDSVVVELSEIISRLIPAHGRLGIFLEFLPYFCNWVPPRLGRFFVDYVPWRDIQILREISDVMEATSAQILKDRRAAIARQGKDLGEKNLMTLLLQDNVDKQLTDGEMTGSMNLFLFAAMDTSSSILSHILHVLARNPAAQEKLRKEVSEARAEKGDMDFDQLNKLPFLDAICRESLRLYTPGPVIVRSAMKDTLLHLTYPIQTTSGTPTSEVFVPTGTLVIMGLLETNSDPRIWGPDAREWKPERWLKPLPQSVKDVKMPGVYSDMMVFSGGERSCIGYKFALMELKITLSVLIDTLIFSPSRVDKDVVWNVSAIRFPTVKGDNTKDAQLPLEVSLAQ